MVVGANKSTTDPAPTSKDIKLVNKHTLKSKLKAIANSAEAIDTALWTAVVLVLWYGMTMWSLRAITNIRWLSPLKNPRTSGRVSVIKKDNVGK